MKLSKSFYFYSVLLLPVVILLWVLWQWMVPDSFSEQVPVTTEVLVPNLEPIQPIPDMTESFSSRKVALGQMLFFDPVLSSDNQIACASCHKFNHGSADNQPKSLGVGGQQGGFNSPPVFNARFNFVQFWNGRAKNLTEQAFFPLLNPVEMGNHSVESLIKKLQQTSHYPELFAEVYSEGMTVNSLIDALVTYQKTLVTPDSRFDQYLKGDQKVLSELEKEGYRLFKSYGCVACHNGVNIGGNVFQRAGVFTPMVPDNHEWLGRYEVTQDPKDRFFFKVPSLRNIAHTAPYFHDGSVKTLDEAIQLMAKHQLGREIQASDVNKIKLFLVSLTGQYQGKYIGSPH